MYFVVIQYLPVLAVVIEGRVLEAALVVEDDNINGVFDVDGSFVVLDVVVVKVVVWSGGLVVIGTSFVNGIIDVVLVDGEVSVIVVFVASS